MKRKRISAMGFASVLMLSGCMSAPGRPGPNPEVPRPEQVLDFATLYGRNCAGCHGSNNYPGAAVPLANPVYLSVVGRDNLLRITAHGIPGTSMPGFGANSTSMLTNRQVEVIVDGMLKQWGIQPAIPGAPPYAAILKGDARRGSQSYATFCASCHGADGKGKDKLGSIVDPVYLSLISDQALRSFVIAGLPGYDKNEAMPDYREAPVCPPYATCVAVQRHPMTDQEVTDVVAWLSSQRSVK